MKLISTYLLHPFKSSWSLPIASPLSLIPAPCYILSIAKGDLANIGPLLESISFTKHICNSYSASFPILLCLTMDLSNPTLLTMISISHWEWTSPTSFQMWFFFHLPGELSASEPHIHLTHSLFHCWETWASKMFSLCGAEVCFWVFSALACVFWDCMVVRSMGFGIYWVEFKFPLSLSLAAWSQENHLTSLSMGFLSVKKVYYSYL